MTISEAPIVAVLKYLLDPFVIVGSLLATTVIYGNPFNGLYLVLAVLTFFLSLYVYETLDLFRLWRAGRLIQHARKIFEGWIIVITLLILLGFASGLYINFSPNSLLAWAITCPLLLISVHHVARHIASRLRSNGDTTRPVVIVGAGELGIKLGQQIKNDPFLFMDVKGYFEDRSGDRLPQKPDSPILGDISELTDYVQTHHIQLIFVCLPLSAQRRIRQLADDLRDSTASIYFVPDIYIFDLVQARFDTLNGIPIVSICETPFLGIDGILKRASDVIVAGMLLLLLSPLMTLIAIAVKLSSPGPVIFRQRRYGLNGEEIIIYKFRSMSVCEDGSDIPQATRYDSRITRLGAILRRSSLDEIPQFINVLQGRMSIVGPRPHAVAHNEIYRKQIKGYMLRHKVKPGITGWAQVNGFRGETDTIEKMNARLKYDMDYLRNWSPALDIWIIIRTAWIVVTGLNAH